MKHLLLTTIAVLVLVGCGPSVDIWEAAKTGNIKAVKQHLAAGPDINTKDNDGRTPLHWATYRDHKEIVDLLIASGADVNAKDVNEISPLLHTIRNENKESVELLIAKGADVNAKNDDGVTPLHDAAAKGHKEIVELLIAKGAKVNAKITSDPNQGLTALDAANQTNPPETADLLRKHGGKTGEELKAEGK